MDIQLKLELKLNQNKHVRCRGARFRSYLLVLLKFRFIFYNPELTGLWFFFLKKYCSVINYIELSTRKI